MTNNKINTKQLELVLHIYSVRLEYFWKQIHSYQYNSEDVLPYVVQFDQRGYFNQSETCGLPHLPANDITLRTNRKCKMYIFVSWIHNASYAPSLTHLELLVFQQGGGQWQNAVHYHSVALLATSLAQKLPAITVQKWMKCYGTADTNIEIAVYVVTLAR